MEQYAITMPRFADVIVDMPSCFNGTRIMSTKIANPRVIIAAAPRRRTPIAKVVQTVSAINARILKGADL